MIYNVHAGHSLKCRGASALLDEVNEDRKVKNAVITYLRQQGHTVYDCTDDVSSTQNDNLSAIVRMCNAHTVDLDISIHLNSGRGDLKGDNRTGGVEVLGFNNAVADIGNRICMEISNELGITNRGFKLNPSLYVLSNTKAPALLIECCFVDDADDAKRWDADKCARAIVKGITGIPVAPPENEYNKKEYRIAGKSKKLFAFKTTKAVSVRVAPNSKADKAATIPANSLQGIDMITDDGWGHLGNKVGWIPLKYTKPEKLIAYVLTASEAAVRVIGSGKSKRVTTLKKGSKQGICFITDDNFGYIGNRVGWVNLKAWKKLK